MERLQGYCELLRQQLKEADMAPAFVQDEVLQLESNLKGALNEKELYWKLKSIVQWLNE